MEYKKGDYIYYVNFAGDTYPTRIEAVGKTGRRINSVLIKLRTFKSDIEYRRWVSTSRIELQNSIPNYMK